MTAEARHRPGRQILRLSSVQSWVKTLLVQAYYYYGSHQLSDVDVLFLPFSSHNAFLRPPILLHPCRWNLLSKIGPFISCPRLIIFSDYGSFTSTRKIFSGQKPSLWY